MSDNTQNLHYIVNHVFCPPKLPQKDDLDERKEYALCAFTYQSARAYRDALPANQRIRWHPMLKMLKNLRISQESSVLSGEHIEQAMLGMQRGDVLAFLIRAQNAGIILRKCPGKTIFESFEVSPPAAVVMAAKGKLLCSYPGPAIAVPSETVDDAAFRKELASFLVQMNVDVLDSAITTTKSKSTVVEERDSAHPRYITELLTQILHGMGEAAEVGRIQKRVGDDVLWKNAFKPWRRSPVWLVIRVALQTSLCQTSRGHIEYKAFMVFMMADILRKGLDSSFSSDLLFCMRAKMSRRLYKLGSAAPDFVVESVRGAGNDIEGLLLERWSMVQNDQAQAAHWAPDELDIISDTRLSLQNSRAYLTQALLSRAPKDSSDTFRPNLFSRYLGICTFSASDNEGLSHAFDENSHVALADFELAVQDHVDDWVSKNLHRSSSCATIAACITQYSDASLKLYDSIPEDLSLMLLTLFELWVALDKLAVAQCPLLKDYSPEVPLELLESLLLRRSKSFVRVKLIHKYLRGRHACSMSGRSIFTDEWDSDTFAVRYFATSSVHQALKSRIEEDAEEERRQKIADLQTLNASHSSLIQRSHSLVHEYRINNRGRELHARWCQKCSLEKQAKSLRIAPHEWPLPQNKFEAKTVVFELDPPIAFSIWRDTTYKILRHICTRTLTRLADPPVQLQNYPGLQKYSCGKMSSRITLASTTKSFLNSHYKTTPIPSTQDSVCVNNGLQFKLIDVGNAWAAHPFTECSVIGYCTPQLPREGPYANLQYAVDGTSHSSNEVMANQSECHKDLTLHEYVAFASLRSGPHLQWLNIARELPTRSLSFHREEVHTLLTQAAWQIGHLAPDMKWHVVLSDARFGCVLLRELEDLMRSIEANWLEGASMRIITALASRLLASANDPDITSRACVLLRTARNVAFGWMHQLVRKLQESEGEGNVQEFQLRVCEMAVTCRGTFDPDHSAALLCFPKDLAVLVECAILAHDNIPPNLKDIPLDFQRLLARDRRLSHSLEPFLLKAVQQYPHGLDDAVVSIWAGYRQGSNWRSLVPPNDRWLTTNTAAEANQESQCVQFNVLAGQLLINGKPLGRLPKSIVEHPTYTRVLGQKILDIIPADIPGMDFVTRNCICGYQVFFGMGQDGTTLLIRTRQGSEILELVPHCRLVNDLPRLLVENYAHWLNLSNGEMELRPIEDPWKSSVQNWRIRFSSSGDSSMHRKSSTLLVDIRTPSFEMISNYLAPLEHAEYLTVTYSLIDQSLLIDLPRFRLSFFLNSRNLLESHNWPGMVIDSRQSTGTMFGLSSQLVLRTENDFAGKLPLSRRVIIPQGKPLFNPRDHHVNIIVDTTSRSSVKYYEYKVDTDLGCLVGNTLASRLFKVYLHAVSSYCLPDPLTGRTGTEEALHELGSACCQSFQMLGETEADILRQISSLTPNRMFYPAHMEVMQTVHWSDLPPLAQHHGFFLITRSIMEYAERLKVFQFQSTLETYVSASDNGTLSARRTHLLERAARRNLVLYPEEFADPLLQINADVVYVSRDLPSKEKNISDISSMVHHWPPRLNTTPRLFDTFELWRDLDGPHNELSLSYSRHWLELDLARVWISLYNLCRASSRDSNRYQLEFSLSAMAYSCSAQNRTLIPIILAFATIPLFRKLDPPSWASYHLSNGLLPQRQELLHIVLSFSVSFEDSPESSLPANYREDEITLGRRRYSSFQARRDSQAAQIVDGLIGQWPCQKPRLPPAESAGLFDVRGLMTPVNGCFLSWYQNRELQLHTRDVQIILDDVHGSDIPADVPVYEFSPCSDVHPPASSLITFNQLLERVPPRIGKPPNILGTPQPPQQDKNLSITNDLQSLLSEFQRSQLVLRRRYGDDLDQSRKSLDHDTNSASIPTCPPYSMEMLTNHRDICKKYVRNVLKSVRQSLLPSGEFESAMYTAGQWPRVTTRSLLGKLAFSSNTVLSSLWREVLITLAQGLLWFQRSERLLGLAHAHNFEELYRELENKGDDNHIIKHNADWLLIQVENNFLMRPIQFRVACEMIDPSSKKNTALQLNMGEGKSSVIVPMVAAALADGRRFVRVVVLKSLSNQMFRLLVDRLSGLLNRRIFYMPFSRTIKLGPREVQHIQTLCKDCMRVGGVLVVQPEHILSFKLMGIDRLFSSKTSEDRKIADALVESQRWLETNSRDILDESDEILHVRYQLVYTVGMQKSIEGHPGRWTTIQQILSLVRKHAPELRRRFPQSVEVQHSRPGVFTPIRILRTDASVVLVSMIAEDILNGALRDYSFGHFGGRVRRAASHFITDMIVPDEDACLIEKQCEGTGYWAALLLLRGLLAHGILVYALKERRWRVDYGLDSSRSMLAVPYRAKDVPSLRAEFGHPDVAITLTCLSYYYHGLSENQLDQCFQLLYKLDNPGLEYESWVFHNDSIPEPLRQLRGVNIKDPEQRKHYLFPLFHHNHAVIDFFLSGVVFPKEAKEFPEKLATSGWDIAETKQHFTTGFSGTNDNRYLLPTSIIQDDQQLSTNARVLTYLLQPENNNYLCTQQHGQVLPVEDFLEVLVRETPQIRVLLDVGAQMLELQNQKLAQHWLSLVQDTPAVIFFSDNDELAVLTRDGTVEAFVSSPFNQQLDKCLVYLDDVHTRGTDLKLPRCTRAAVTLGPKVTKDRLLQGCMRMRKLGHGQSVMFFAPPEVDRRIRSAAGKNVSDAVRVLDILRWAMLETCADIQHHVPHWAQQGVDHERRNTAWNEFSSRDSSVEALRPWLQAEARTLQAMYGLLPSVGGNHQPIHAAFTVPELRDRCRELGVMSFTDTRMEEEQEREVNHEVERELHVERPPKAKAARHNLHSDVIEFVKTGIIPPRSLEFVSPLFPFATRNTAFSSRNIWSPRLLTTRDFSTTIQGSVHSANDYLRPVHWILSAVQSGGTLFVVLSPYEVDNLLPRIQSSNAVHLHQYAPRVTHSMRSFDDLEFYCIPSLPPSWTGPEMDLRNQLNLWAGQLFFPDRETYLRLCNFLGVYSSETRQDITIQSDGFIKPYHRLHGLQPPCPFAKSPLSFFRELIGLRRKGMCYSSTHLGKILNARLLTEEDFD